MHKCYWKENVVLGFFVNKSYLRRIRRNSTQYLLIAPVQPHCEVSLDLSHLILCQVPREQLPAEVNELIHHMPQFVEKIYLMFL